MNSGHGSVILCTFRKQHKSTLNVSTVLVRMLRRPTELGVRTNKITKRSEHLRVSNQPKIALHIKLRLPPDGRTEPQSFVPSCVVRMSGEWK